MRKITSYLSLPVISGSQHKILGTITGVLCEKRLKSVGFFAFSDLYSKDSENMYVAARSLKKINDDSVVLSNLLCIKSQSDVSGKDLIDFPLGAPVYTADGKALGVPAIEKPEKDFKVSILSPPENALSLPVKALSNYEFLIGRVATSSVYDKNNVPIVKKGALVTKKVVFDAHRKNRLIALTLATKR